MAFKDEYPKRRFIPACAGNTGIAPAQSTEPPVHPRLCGEHSQPRIDAGPNDGSSPPVRGTRNGGDRILEFHRFIPACAGNTWGVVRGSVGLPVHPRLCGEHSRIATQNVSYYGSSPPVRGTRGLGVYSA